MNTLASSHSLKWIWLYVISAETYWSINKHSFISILCLPSVSNPLTVAEHTWLHAGQKKHPRLSPPACQLSSQSEWMKNPTCLLSLEKANIDQPNAMLPPHLYCPKTSNCLFNLGALMHPSGTVWGRTEAITWDDRQQRSFLLANKNRLCLMSRHQNRVSSKINNKENIFQTKETRCKPKLKQVKWN